MAYTFFCMHCHTKQPYYEEMHVCGECYESLKCTVERNRVNLDELTTIAIQDSEEEAELRKERDAALKILHEDCDYSLGEIFRAMQLNMED